MSILNFLIHVMIMAGIYSILALSLNFQVGFIGLMNFGHVAFFAVGAYTSALLTLAGYPFLLGLFSAMLLAGLFGFIISLPTSGLKEDYWAIVTIAAGEILRLFLLNEQWLAEGPFGLRGIPRPLASLFSENYSLFYLVLVLLFVAFTYFILEVLIRSPFGRVLKMIREEEALASSMGKEVYLFKIRGMVIGAIFAGLAGSLYAHYMTFISPDHFMPIETFLIWVMIVIGGRGNNIGAIIGAVTIESLYVSTRFLKDYVGIPSDLLASLRMFMIGFLLVIFVLYKPEGLVGEKRRSYKMRKRC